LGWEQDNKLPYVLNHTDINSLLWRRSALEAIPYESSHSNGYVFIVELAYMAKLAGLTFAEIPIYFSERTQGESRMSLRIQVEAAFRVWQLKGMYKEVKPIDKL